MRSTLAREGKIDVRIDEEQNKKVQEIILVLFNAGYYRARIKGLSPFDKIVGGMTWCIELSNYDVDVDLLFHDSLTIGQKIALTERIVQVLPSMKCPYKIEPHQIQGLDAIHIFPVIKWLVTLAVATRAEYEDQTRLIALDEFNRNFCDKELKPLSDDDRRVIGLIRDVRLMYTPRRKFRQPTASENKSTNEKLIYTLLEYGESDAIAEIEEKTTDVIVEECEKQLWDKLRDEMVLEEDVPVPIYHEEAGNQSIAIQSIEDQLSNLSSLVDVKREEVERLEMEEAELVGSLADWKVKVEDVTERIRDYEDKNEKVDAGQASKISQLVTQNEHSKKTIQEFKENCRNEAEKMQERVEKLKETLAEAEKEDHTELLTLKDSEKERLNFFKRRLAKKTREVETLRRKIDDVPGGAELAQYQRRFVELYELVGAQQHEMLQFYSLYNSLADEKSSMEREMGLLNSVSDNLENAMLSDANLDDLIRQLNSMLDGIRQNKFKLERKLGEAKAERDRFKNELHRLQELHIQYVRSIHEFSQEATKNEILLKHLGQLSS